jgi:hypothetical protein
MGERVRRPATGSRQRDCGYRRVMPAAPSLPSHTPRDWAIELTVAAVAGAFLGLVGPFGSYYNDAVLPRVAYWMATFLMSSVAYGLLIRWTLPRAQAAGVPWWAWLPALVVVATVPMAAASRLIALAIWPFLSKIGWLEWYGQSLLITVFYAAGYMLLRLGGWRRPTIAAPDADGEAAFLRRIPARLGREVLCLQMEDHYVRVHTSQGSDLVLMSLGQAMAELAAMEGLQVHRSWWVARHAVDAVVEDGRNLRLRLVNGIEAPVSRTSVAKLRAAGWIDG